MANKHVHLIDRNVLAALTNQSLRTISRDASNPKRLNLSSLPSIIRYAYPLMMELWCDNISPEKLHLEYLAKKSPRKKMSPRSLANLRNAGTEVAYNPLKKPLNTSQLSADSPQPDAPDIVDQE